MRQYDEAFATIAAQLPRLRPTRRRRLRLGRKLLRPESRPIMAQIRVDPLYIDYNTLVTCCVCKCNVHPTQLRAYINVSFCPVSHMTICRACVRTGVFVKQIAPG